MAVAVPEEQVAEAAVEPAELGKKAEFVTAQDEVRMAVMVDVEAADGVNRGKLDNRGKALDAEVAVAFIEWR